MDVTIEDYAEFISHLMAQAEEENFTYEIDFSEIMSFGEPLSKGNEE